MKEICLTSILIICVIMLSICLTGCINRTSIPNSSPDSATVIPTELRSSPSAESNEAVDYNQYIKKVWVVKNETNDFELYPSFCINKIVNGEITGFFDIYPAVGDTYDNYENLFGKIINGIAECQFDNGSGIKGNIKIVFKTNDEVEATVEYLDRNESYNYLSKEGVYQFTPYNVDDIEDFIPTKSRSFMVDLNSWGNIKFVSGKIEGERYTDVIFYLTDKDENILYEICLDATTVNIDVNDISFQDANKDGLKDIIMILNTTLSHHGRIEPIVNVFFQKNNGTFANDSKLGQEINDSGNNKDIKTITDYLSKKF